MSTGNASDYKVDTLSDKRPFGIQLDVEALNRRRKVSQVLSGSVFKDELESVLKNQISGPPKRSTVLKKLQDTVIPASVLEAARQATPLPPPLQVGELIIPINDLRGSNASKYAIPERQLRCKLASVCRLTDLFGWSSLIHNLVTAVCSAVEQKLLANPFGLMCYEVTASNLVKVGFQGDISDHGGTQFGVDHADLPLHLSVYARRPDIKCIISASNSASIAVSCMNCGLLGISEKALMIGEISYMDPNEDVDVHPMSKILFVRGQGLLALGQSVEEAFHYAFHAVSACEIQVSAITAGMGNLSVFSLQNGLRPVDQQREFEGLMRMLDNKGYNTGYEYKCWDLFQPPSDAGYEVRKKERESKRAKLHLEQRDNYPHDSATPPLTIIEPATAQKDNHRADPNGETEQQRLGQKDFARNSELLRSPVEPRTYRRLPNLNSNAQNIAETSAVVPDSTRRHTQAPFTQPLERAMNAAKQVAYSTHQAVEKLILHELPSQEIRPLLYQPSTTAVSAPTFKSEPPHVHHHVTSGLIHSNGQWCTTANDDGSSALYAKTELFSNDQVSAEKAAKAARVVAKNTAEAVRKITSSLKDPATFPFL